MFRPRTALGQEWPNRTDRSDRGSLPKQMVRKVPTGDIALIAHSL